MNAKKRSAYDTWEQFREEYPDLANAVDARIGKDVVELVRLIVGAFILLFIAILAAAFL